MTTVKNDALRALHDALQHVDSLIAAANGDSSRCGVFSDKPWLDEKFTEEQRRSVRIYVESWIREPLDAAIRSIEGDRSCELESYLETVGRIGG